MSEESRKNVMPSAFMRQLRPELYSDTMQRTAYLLDAATLEYHLETITARNQTHSFEIFCRKLCERKICPNLKPATGPEGGGDSKADTETIPVSNEVAILSYIGEASASQERWAFAFSANAKWGEKIRSDVAGVVATKRGYKKIICVTSRFARAKDRARIEDELSNKYDLTVTILDRSWIVEQVINGNQKDLAYNYLNVGQESADIRRLGPSDYSRVQQLEDIEAAMENAETFVGMEMQRVTEALVAAKLSRSLELPRIETEGRFSRAIRLAKQDGTYRQELEANYEWIWTAFWWFDDVKLLNNSYDDFEKSVIETSSALNIELLCNLAQLLVNSVVHQHLTISEARLDERIKLLSDKLGEMTKDLERPNNALEARTSLLVLQVNQALIKKKPEELSQLWPQFSEVVVQAKGLGEFSANRLTQLIEVFGSVAGDDESYAQLVDDISVFVSERTGEAQGALVLLKRAQQLGFKDSFEMIRLLGKASRQLTKREYIESLIEALQLLALAYSHAGLFWAARATCVFGIASILIETGDDAIPSPSILATLVLFANIALEIRHIPDAFAAVELIRHFEERTQLEESYKDHLVKDLQNFELNLGSRILNFTSSELQKTTQLPDVLRSLGLHLSRIALLYTLGYELKLREEGTITEDETSEQLVRVFTTLASQVTSKDLILPVIFNGTEKQSFKSILLGMQLVVFHDCTEASILAAETVIGAIEAFFATILNLRVLAHAEIFTIRIREELNIQAPDFDIDPETMSATVRWPTGMIPSAFGRGEEVIQMLIPLAGSIFTAACFVKERPHVVENFFKNETVIERIGMIAVAGNSYQRAFKKNLSRISDWEKFSKTNFTPELSRPILNRKTSISKKPIGATEEKIGEEMPILPNDHRELNVRSIIDVHLWDRARWAGTVYADWGADYPPAIALLFTDEDAGKKIFTRWRQRFGDDDKYDEIYLAIVRGISKSNPAGYRILVTSSISENSSITEDIIHVVPTRIQTMLPSSDENLSSFLNAYSREETYYLLPAILKDGKPKFLMDLAILKRRLSVKKASEIGQHDIEKVALGGN